MDQNQIAHPRATNRCHGSPAEPGSAGDPCELQRPFKRWSIPIGGLCALITVLHFTSPLIAATPATLDDFADALSDAKPPPALEALTGDQALLAHVQALASSGEPESVALARTSA